MNEETRQELNAFLDGSLAPAERQAFEQRVKEDPALRKELAAQKALQDSLKRNFTPASMEALNQRVMQAALNPGGSRGRIHKGPGFRGGMLVAAAVLLVAGGAWWWQSAGGGGNVGGPGSSKKGMTKMEMATASTLGAEWVNLYEFSERVAAKQQKNPLAQMSCTSPENLNVYLPEKIMSAEGVLSFKETKGGCGLLEEAPLAGKSRAPLFQVDLACEDGSFALVFVFDVTQDPQTILPEEAHLNLFRKELGGYLLYELTPLDKSKALEHFYLGQE